jgi:predicted ATPase
MGGMSAVYRATDLRLDAAVAIKHRQGTEGILADAFEQEARLLASLRHPVLPKVTDYFVEGSDQYLVMEFVAGDDLATQQRRAGQPFSVAQVLAWADRVLDALAYLHGHDPPVFHRDVKPANLKPTAQGSIALLDFGLARRRSGAETTLAGYTLTYAPPEQISGAETTGRGDLYALAATLHDLLTGKPFPDAVQRLAAAEAGQPDPLHPVHELNPDVPVSVSLALAQALALNPHRRPASAEAMRELLRQASDERATVHVSAPVANPGRPGSSAGNLLSWLSPLIGRQREVAAVQHLLGDEGARLVTLTGPGGTGKTRLALAVAEGIAERYRDGVWFVDLAPISDPNLVASSIADALGIRGRGTAAVTDALRDHLQAREALLILDNFEQVLSAAPLVVSLLTACPDLRVLTTSREPLRLRGEREFPVTPLPLPDAVALFVERARAVQPEFAASGDLAHAVSEICARLDGLPLAIELAAARTRLLPPGAMLARLERRLHVVASGPRDLPARQQTLRRTIDWSHDLLTPEEQHLFARLAVFVGGRTLEAIEAVCNADGALADDVLDGVESLVGKNLLRQTEGVGGEPRLVFLETINEYARERLEASGEAVSLRRAHAEYYLALAEASLPGLIGPEQGQWMARLVEEHDNLRAALGSARDLGENELWLQLAGALWRFWDLRFHHREGQAWLEAALAADRGTLPVVRAKALAGVANLVRAQGDLIQAAAYQDEALGLFRAAGDQLGIARTLNDLANTVGDRGDFAGAIALYEESLTVAREIGASWECACALHNIGLTAHLLDDNERADALLAEAVTQWLQLGDEVSRARTLDVSGEVAQCRGATEQAVALHEESLALRRDFGDRHGVALSLSNLGLTLLARSEGQRARASLQEALRLYHEAGIRHGMALCLTGLAMLSAARGRPEEATRLLGAADALGRADGAVLRPAHRRHCEQALATVDAALSKEVFAVAWAAGQALSPEQAVALALGQDG